MSTLYEVNTDPIKGIYSNIEPILHLEAPITITLWGTTYNWYNSAICTSINNTNGLALLFIFESQPIITGTLSPLPTTYAKNGYYVMTFTIAGGYGEPLNSVAPIFTNDTDFKEYAFEPYVPPVLYNWQSVPSISGKNGILTLSTLNDVNDGEPVETSDTSKFNLTDDSNVSALVTARLSE